VLGLLRHVYLALAVLLAATGARFIICAYDPFVPLLRGAGSAGMVITGGAMVLLSMVVARPYCRFLCPYGVLLGWAARVASFRLRPATGSCFDCRLCEASCPSGALLPPTPQLPRKDRPAARRRLARLLIVAPVVVVACAWLGSQLDWLLARAHPTVSLAERVIAEDLGSVSGTTLESRTHRAGIVPTEALRERAETIRRSFRTGGALVGAYLALVVMAQLVGLSRHRGRRSYEPDPADCVACGRCLEHCPQGRDVTVPRLREAA
jgi:ferredoxin